MSIFNRRYPALQSSLLAVLIGMLAVLFTSCRTASVQQLPQSNCQRVVSLSPSVTEILYTLGMGKQVAGVTRFCKYPADARTKPSVGGYVDPNLEALVRLKPDLVIIRTEQTGLVHQVRALNVPVLTVEHRNMDGILTSFEQIGQVCHRENQANAYVSGLQARIQAVKKTLGQVRQKPSVLVAMEGDVHTRTIHWVYVAGPGSIYDWVINQAGGVNAVPPGRTGFVQISAEGILRMNPDVIIELLPYSSKIDPAMVRKQWETLPSVAAVRNHRVILFSHDYMMIPGPRFVGTLEQFARVIHPELRWPELN